MEHRNGERGIGLFGMEKVGKIGKGTIGGKVLKHIL